MNYPAVKKHLSQFYKVLEKRADKGDTPYNLRNCAYMEDFSRQKIVWKRVGSILRFSYDESGLMTLDSTCFATGKQLKFLVAILNSKMGKYLLKDSPQTGTGDLLISVQAIEPILIPFPEKEVEQCICRLADSIFNSLSSNLENEDAENELNNIVYSMYNLDQAEINFIEGY